METVAENPIIMDINLELFAVSLGVSDVNVNNSNNIRTEQIAIPIT
jgi:hypothetical protein